MKILFGIQGTGNGHLSRCHRIATELKKHPVQVDYLISGRRPESLFNVDVFGDFVCRRGLSFVTRQGQVSHLKTLLSNSFSEFVSDVRRLDVSSYDLVVSDFEPITAWAAKRAGKRCIGIGRQYAFKEKPLYQHLNLFQRTIIDHFAPANEWLGMHWSPLGDCLPPVVRKSEDDTPNVRQVLVYLPFEELYHVVDSLLAVEDYTFSVFHPDIKQVKYFASDHVIGFPASRKTFAEQLSVSTAVIANAGFETTCEALNRAKHLAVKPVNGQFEQYWNAKLLQQKGLATVFSELNEESLLVWLAEINGKPCPAKTEWGNVAASLANWLSAGATQAKQELIDELWSGSPGWIRTNDTWINSPPL